LERRKLVIYIFLFVPSLFKKGLSENPSNDVVGVINRRNGCGPTVEVKDYKLISICKSLYNLYSLYLKVKHQKT
jgi:hypothetical protein